MAFGKKLKEVRKRSGLTQEEFAEQLQVSRQAVSKWESGRGYPEMEKLIYLCNCYGVSMDQLFTDEIPAEKPPEAPIPRKPLSRQLSGFYANLSRYNKFIAFFLLLVLILLGPAYSYLMQTAKGGIDEKMAITWIALIVILGAAEAATAGLVSIWFVLGSVAALIVCELGGELWLQGTVFLVVSLAALIFTRPLAKKMLEKRIIPTNADRVLHRQAKVTETIDNENASGAVYADGKTWSARSEDGSIIPVGSMVTIVKMEGVKLFVKLLK